jgi:hypothetical protein
MTPGEFERRARFNLGMSAGGSPAGTLNWFTAIPTVDAAPIAQLRRTSVGLAAEILRQARHRAPAARPLGGTMFVAGGPPRSAAGPARDER